MRTIDQSRCSRATYSRVLWVLLGWLVCGAGAASFAASGHELVEAVTRLYSYLFGETEAAVRPTAVYRVQAMDLSDQWVKTGCRPDSPVLAQEHAALVRCYASLLAAVHH